ncbi:hypothetical protein QJS10_CPB12g00430 [Acorus calamus]|uniref:Uncharacterized protein n=1 Tax=Acorus calamus TaxID=4465 RepID=A0AAV9DPJ7_ACOCL|nr:hypothetical protein QJS10_CPB12g00430 [Acorus calamus]
MSIELKLSRSNRIYRPNEPIQGKIVITLSSPISHSEIRVTAVGTVDFQVRKGMTGVIESLYSIAKPICIVRQTTVVKSFGRLGSGCTEIPFCLNLRSQESIVRPTFYETYHGANISIQYLITADILRGYLHKSLSATMEFLIESDKDNLWESPLSPDIVSFYITQDTQKHQLLPELLSDQFKVAGKIATCCSLSEPLRGEITVEASMVPIHSIDIQLLRVESILVGEKFVTDASVIQMTQIADGDICRSMTLPIYIILPRLLVCPTMSAGSFSVEFQVSVIISFQSELSKTNSKSDLRTPKPWLAMETLPLRLLRTK